MTPEEHASDCTKLSFHCNLITLLDLLPLPNQNYGETRLYTEIVICIFLVQNLYRSIMFSRNAPYLDIRQLKISVFSRNLQLIYAKHLAHSRCSINAISFSYEAV